MLSPSDADINRTSLTGGLSIEDADRVAKSKENWEEREERTCKQARVQMEEEFDPDVAERMAQEDLVRRKKRVQVLKADETARHLELRKIQRDLEVGEKMVFRLEHKLDHGFLGLPSNWTPADLAVDSEEE